MWEDFQTIRDVLERERGWRASVFRGRRQQEKVREVDDASGELHPRWPLERIKLHLRELGEVVEPPVQMPLLQTG